MAPRCKESPAYKGDSTSQHTIHFINHVQRSLKFVFSLVKHQLVLPFCQLTGEAVWRSWLTQISNIRLWYIGWGKGSGATPIAVYFCASPSSGDANWITLAAKRSVNKQTSRPAGIDNRLYVNPTQYTGKSGLDTRDYLASIQLIQEHNCFLAESVNQLSHLLQLHQLKLNSDMNSQLYVHVLLMLCFAVY